MKDGFLVFDEIVKCIVGIMKIDGGRKMKERVKIGCRLSSFVLKQKNQKFKTGSFCLIDIDFFKGIGDPLKRIAKKIEFLPRKSPNSGGSQGYLANLGLLPPLKQGGFLGSDYLEGRLGRNSNFS